ncbi:hypothetical protein [uncultured Eubacterium sp.]|uniref:hypothetical protein n=1 Tax=uncultured Eubacterium sp. TaxID=165185 RepID=UPI0025970A1A|nr:hypothetical protein [uncultured Eubacterium sp.]
MTGNGAIMHCHDAKRDADDFDELMNELKSIKRDKKTIQDMELSEEAKQKCFKDLDKQLEDVKERMHNAIDEM